MRMAMGMHAAAARWQKTIVREEIDPRGAEADEGLARPDHTRADATAHVVARTGHYRRVGGQRPAFRGLAPQGADYRRAFDESRQAARPRSRPVADGGAPDAGHVSIRSVALPSVPSHAISPVSRRRTKSFGITTWRVRSRILRFVLCEPTQLGGREARHRARARQSAKSSNAASISAPSSSARPSFQSIAGRKARPLASRSVTPSI